jgi:23S rRNA-/tRNA-specific pseudouridylate synthase
VHPTGGASSGGDKRRGTLVDLLTARFGEDGLSGINGPEARGIVHRLDRPTSGIILVARSDEAHALLVAAWYQRRVEKTYLALVEGVPGLRRKTQRHERRGSGGGTRGLSDGDGGGGGGINVAPDNDDMDFAPDGLSGIVVEDADGRPARSTYRVLEIFCAEEGASRDGGGGGDATTAVTTAATCSLVEVKPKTGRKHQVRQHMGLALDAPLVGDTLYRKGKAARTPTAAAPLLTASGGKPGAVMFLHSAALELDHPVTGAKLHLSDPLPRTFDGLLASLRRQTKADVK